MWLEVVQKGGLGGGSKGWVRRWFNRVCLEVDQKGGFGGGSKGWVWRWFNRVGLEVEQEIKRVC